MNTKKSPLSCLIFLILTFSFTACRTVKTEQFSIQEQKSSTSSIISAMTKQISNTIDSIFKVVSVTIDYTEENDSPKVKNMHIEAKNTENRVINTQTNADSTYNFNRFLHQNSNNMNQQTTTITPTPNITPFTILVIITILAIAVIILKLKL